MQNQNQNSKAYNDLSKLKWQNDFPLDITLRKLLKYLDPNYRDKNCNLFENVGLGTDITQLEFKMNKFDLYIYSLNGLYKKKVEEKFLLHPPNNYNNKNKYKIVNGYAQVNIAGVKFVGLKVMDIFKIYELANPMLQNFGNTKQIFKQIKKSNRDYSCTILQDSNNFDNISDFANRVLFFKQSSDIAQLFAANYYNPIEICESMRVFSDIFGRIFKTINKNLIENLVGRCDEKFEEYKEQFDTCEYFIFSKPKSLLSILSKYYSESKEYHLLKNLVKPNRKQIYILNSIEDFSKIDSDIMDIKCYDKIYLKTWNFQDKFYTFENINYFSKSNERYYTHFSYIASIINEKYRKIQKQNKPKFIYKDYEKKGKNRSESVWYGYKIKDINKNRSKKVRYYESLIHEEL